MGCPTSLFLKTGCTQQQGGQAPDTAVILLGAWDQTRKFGSDDAIVRGVKKLDADRPVLAEVASPFRGEKQAEQLFGDRLGGTISSVG